MAQEKIVIFRNYSKEQVWEVSKKHTSMYIPYDIIKRDDAVWQLEMILAAFELPDMADIIKTMLEYTDNPQEDMFIVEV